MENLIDGICYDHREQPLVEQEPKLVEPELEQKPGDCWLAVRHAVNDIAAVVVAAVFLAVPLVVDSWRKEAQKVAGMAAVAAMAVGQP